MEINYTNSIGQRGEFFFKNFLIENDIKFIDNRLAMVLQDREYYDQIRKTTIKYKTLIKKHQFDFIVNNLNIEIKTSKILYKNTVGCVWSKNDFKNIHYVILFVIDRTLNFHSMYIFDNKYINQHPAVKFQLNTRNKVLKRHSPITEEELLALLITSNKKI